MNTDMFRDAEEKEEHASRTVTLSSQDIQAVVRILSRFTRQKPSALEQQLLGRDRFAWSKTAHANTL